MNTLDEECYETKECEDVVIPENLRCLNTTIIYEETKTCEPYCEGNICISECYDYCDAVTGITVLTLANIQKTDHGSALLNAIHIMNLVGVIVKKEQFFWRVNVF